MAKDTFELTSDLIKGVSDRENKARQNDFQLYKQSVMEYAISPLYARYIGDTVTIAFNGNFKKFPVNGSVFKLSKGHYNSLMKYLHHIDRQIRVSKNNAKFMDQNVSGDFKKLT